MVSDTPLSIAGAIKHAESTLIAKTPSTHSMPAFYYLRELCFESRLAVQCHLSSTILKFTRNKRA